MLRAFFLAVGVFCVSLGLECLVIEKAVLFPKRDTIGTDLTTMGREIAPAEWAPWTLLSCGAVVMLYSFTIPAKMRG